MFGGNRWSNEAYRAPRNKSRWSSEEYHPRYDRHPKRSHYLTVPEPTKYWRDFGKAKFPSPRGHIPRIAPRGRRMMFGGSNDTFNWLYLLFPVVAIVLTILLVHFNTINNTVIVLGVVILMLGGIATIIVNITDSDDESWKLSLENNSIALILLGIVSVVIAYLVLNTMTTDADNTVALSVLSGVSFLLTFLQTTF